MIINWVSVQAYRSIDTTGRLDLGPVTVLIGRNNSGKSALLRAMYLAQAGSQFHDDDRRLRSGSGPQVDMSVAAPPAQAIADAYSSNGAFPPDLGIKIESSQSDPPTVRLVWNQGQAAQGSGAASGPKAAASLRPCVLTSKGQRMI
jgi:hypothetical protein